MIQPGSKLAHYEVVSALGKGGMGEVWRAKDTKLGREVAIKTLPPEFAQDADRLARFEREAKLLASLNHPNIAAIYGLEQHEGTRFLVLELVEGDTLADRIGGGAIPVEDSLKLALQIAEALEAAHEKGVIHRDLKPANIKVTPDGNIKVLDFGLAKAFTGDVPGVYLSQSPTLSMAATAQGVVLGTAAYMSPEQARGVSVDKRADIWAFGCVLYEMLTGRQVFGGELMSDVMASVLKSDPNYQGLPPATPQRLRSLLERCLQKDPKQRWHDVGDLRVELEHVLAAPFDPAARVSGSAGTRFRLGWVAAVGAALVVGWVAATIFRDPVVTESGGIADLIEFPLPLPDDVRTIPFTQTPLVLSPDGRRLAVVAIGNDGQQRVWLRNLNAQTFGPVEGTDGVLEVFWAPDSQSIGFVTADAISRIPITGGNVRTVAMGQNLTHGNWGNDERILFSTFGSVASQSSPRSRVSGGIRSVSAGGGDVTLLTDPLEDGGSGHFWPTFLDDGRRFIYHSLGAGIFLHSVDGGEPQLLLERSFSERSSIFLVPGYLLYVENDVLWARSFDQLTLELGDDVVSIRDSVPTLGRGTAPATLSSNGLLAFWSSPVGGAMEFQWFDRNGEPLGHFGSAAVYSGFSLSPGGDRLAFSRVDSTGARDLWTLGPQGREQKITFDGDSSAPVWSPDGEGLLFTSAQELPPNLFRISSIGADPERLDEEVNVQISGNWSPDQSQIVFSQSSTTRANEIMVMDWESGEVTEGSVNSEFSETGPRLSLDGRWLAYVYDGSGQSEVWLASFPDAAMMMPIGPGSFPEWGNNELYYISDDEQMMSLEFDTSGSGPGAAVPNALFSISNYVPPFDIGLSVFQVTADGQRFLISVEAEDVVTPPINVILNWTELLEE